MKIHLFNRKTCMLFNTMIVMTYYLEYNVRIDFFKNYIILLLTEVYFTHKYNDTIFAGL